MNAPFLYRLKCFRCKRNLPEDQFCPANGTEHERGTVNRFEPPYAKHLHKLCRGCRGQIHSEWTKHPLYSPAVDRYWRRRHVEMRQSAKVRKIKFQISSDDLLGQYLTQDGKCALTGVQMICQKTHGRFTTSTSVDRIDSKEGYVRGNIQIVCRVVNTMKSDMDHADFLKWCQAVLSYQARREDEIFAVLG